MMDHLATLLLLIGLLAYLHFMYEAVVAPSIRLWLRFRLFALRDELRELKCESKVSDEAFRYLQSGINGGLDRLHALNLHTLYVVNAALARDQGLKSRSRSNRQLITRSGPELKQIDKQGRRFMAMAFVVNSGAWTFYLIPMVLIGVMFKKLASTAKWLFSATEGDRNAVAPIQQSSMLHAG